MEFNDKTVQGNGKTLKLLVTENLEGKPGYRPLVASVTWEGGEWRWVGNHYPKGARAEHFLRGDDHMIVILHNNQVLDVYKIADLHKYHLVSLNKKDGPKYEGRGMTAVEVLGLKYSVAKAIRKGVFLTSLERVIDAKEKEAKATKRKQEDSAKRLAHAAELNAKYEANKKAEDSKKRLAEAARKHAKYLANLAAEKAAKEKQEMELREAAEKRLAEAKAHAEEEERKKAERHARSEQVRNAIKARPQLKGHADGKRYFAGVPVTESEWPRLYGGAHCILVENYDDEKKTFGKILGCFIVEDKNGRKKKFNLLPFTSQNQPKVGVQSLGDVIYTDAKGNLTSSIAYKSVADIEKLRAEGLNSGTVVAVKLPDEENQFELFSVSKKQLSSKGKVAGELHAH